jgi:hypothetical protein
MFLRRSQRISYGRKANNALKVYPVRGHLLHQLTRPNAGKI